jgi:hypothetical protein
MSVTIDPRARRACREDNRMDPRNRQRTDCHDSAGPARMEGVAHSWNDIMNGIKDAEAAGHRSVPIRTMDRWRRESDDAEVFSHLGWTWNVDLAKEIVGKRPARVHVDVASTYRHLEPNLEMIDRERTMSEAVALGEPLIGLILRMGGEDSLVIIEGWDRVYRAHHDRTYTLPVRVLTSEEEREIRLEGLWDLLDQ